MTSAEVLLCVIVDLLRTQKVNESLKLEELMKLKDDRDNYALGLFQGRINLCEDLIRFIKNNVEGKVQ